MCDSESVMLMGCGLNDEHNEKMKMNQAKQTTED